MPDHHDYTTSWVGLASHTFGGGIFVVCKMQGAFTRRRFVLPGVREEAGADGERGEGTEARERHGNSLPAERQAVLGRYNLFCSVSVTNTVAYKDAKQKYDKTSQCVRAGRDRALAPTAS